MVRRIFRLMVHADHRAGARDPTPFPGAGLGGKAGRKRRLHDRGRCRLPPGAGIDRPGALRRGERDAFGRWGVHGVRVGRTEVGFLQDNITIIFGGIVFAFAIGYGFASRNIMSNLLAALYSRNKFNIGDDIKIDGTRGTIIEIDSTSLTLQTSDRRVVFPLNQLTTQRVEVFGNWDETPRIEE